MDDTISRQEAIRIASGYCHPANIANELAKLPSAQPGWIPCNEALPARNGKYLCTNTAWGAYIIDFDMWTDGSWWSPEDEHIAWMPLPEPYQREDQK